MYDIIYLLLNAGASIEGPVLHLAVNEGHTLLVEELLRRDADFNEMRNTMYGETPLMIAGKKGYSKIIEILCACGARDNILDGEGNNALTITTHSLDWNDTPSSLENNPGHKKSIKLLCKYGSDLDIRPRCNRYKTPIESAEQYSHQTVIDLLRSLAQNRKDK